jgi:pyrroloquinoline quinone biosynthesis protein B
VTVPLGGSFPDYVSPEFKATLRQEEAVCGFAFQQGTTRVFFAPSLPGTSTEWKEWAELSDLTLIDGTFWSDDELIRTGRTKKTAREMGHLPLSGANGLMEQYPKKGRGRRVLIHINNTNPILDEESVERRAVVEAGFEIAYDGMDFVL